MAESRNSPIPAISDSLDSPIPAMPFPVMSAATHFEVPPTIPHMFVPTQSPFPSPIQPIPAPYVSPSLHGILHMSVPSNDASASTTKRKRRTAEDAAEERAKREAKRAAKERERKEKDEETRRRQAENAVRLQLARKAKVDKAPRFKWTTAATEELVQLVSQLKFEHDSVLEANPGFIPWSKFFKENSARKEAFDTLKDVPFDALDRRYKAICTTYKASPYQGAIKRLILLSFSNICVTHSVFDSIVIKICHYLFVCQIRLSVMSVRKLAVPAC